MNPNIYQYLSPGMNEEVLSSLERKKKGEEDGAEIILEEFWELKLAGTTVREVRAE